MERYMRQAIELARFAIGQTGVNPVVGAVLVKEGRIVGFGAHLKAGDPHAEVHAVRMAGAAANGATLYVTLEPCSHYGKTPPCADLIVESGVKRVVVAMEDPNPLVAGKGLMRLKASGIEVEVGMLNEEARALNPAFLRSLDSSRPYIILKTATSLDGKIALETGESKWVTGVEARRDVHELRSSVDAILTGIGTVLADDPNLTVRCDRPTRKPDRVILDRDLRIPMTSKLARTAGDIPVIVYMSSDDVERREMVQTAGVILRDYTSLGRVLEDLYVQGVGRLLVEAGPTLVTSLLDGGYVDEWVLYQSPRVFGGKNGVYRSPREVPIDAIERFAVQSVETVGPDVKIVLEKRDSFDANEVNE